MSAPPTYLDPDTLPFPFCPGCGHGTILERLDEALARRGVDPARLVVVSDIGCSGLSDKFFATHAFHGLHGRSVTYATGIKLARPELDVVVLMGDGGCGIGGHHLINAARRNVGVTVIVFNNLNYGMTGGEHSVSTPPGSVTSTTPGGHFERPMDICRTVEVNGASFVARTTTFDADVTELMVRAMENDGFSLVDVWELCTAYYAPTNRLSRKAMDGVLKELSFPTGVLLDEPRAELAAEYRRRREAVAGEEAVAARPLASRYESGLDAPLRWLLAGAAGKRIGTAAEALARGGVLSGLWATQRGDYPVTVRTGFSLAEVILDPEEILFTGIPSPDVVLDLFPEGHARIADRIAALEPGARLYQSAELPEPDTAAAVVRLDFASVEGFGRKKDIWGMMAVAVALRDTGAYPVDAFLEAVEDGEKGEARRAAVEAALSAWSGGG